jgi:hypothetical protein
MEMMEGDMTGTPMGICPTFYAIADAATGEILNVTRRITYAAKRLRPGTVWGSGLTAEAAKAAAKKVKAKPPYPDPNAMPPDAGADVPLEPPKREPPEEVPAPAEEDIPF